MLLEKLLKDLKAYPIKGSPLGKDCYKIRLPITSKGRGKSGGGRVITCVKMDKDKIYFLSLYDKSEQSTITDKDLKLYIQIIAESGL